MRKPIQIWKDAYTIRMKDRRITVRRTEKGDWVFTFISLVRGKVIKKYYDNIITRGQRHICAKYLRLSDEAVGNIIAGYIHFAHAHNLSLIHE